MITRSQMSLTFLWISLFALSATAQTAPEEQKTKRTVMLPTPPKPYPERTKPMGPTPPPVEKSSVGTMAQVVEQALAARPNGWISEQVQDSVAEGTMTFFNVDGPQATFEVSLLRKGDRQLQRVTRQNGKELRQGSDGTTSWTSLDGMSSNATGHVQHFIEGLTDRSFRSLFKASSPEKLVGTEVHDLGMKGDARVLEVFEKPDSANKDGRKTRYFVDAATFVISRIDMVTGEIFDTFLNRKMETTESVAFSDYRDVNGVMTPFKIESFINGFKVDEMQFGAISHNQSVQDRSFRP